MKQKTKKRNSIGTENPYNLIQTIKLYSKENKNLKIEIIGKEHVRVGKDEFEMKKFDIIGPEKSEDMDTYKLFSRIKRFGLMSGNIYEIVSLIIDTYKMNKDKLGLKIATMPVYRNALDSKFVYNELLN